ncbi:type II toxin-antitoxin system PemK/MazF family toxin [Clostridium tertium]|uniref:mRNA interferase n=1 Tax=Clostridium tertium TaxID=1559 RepID=A0A6N3FPS4_9CLOT
MEYIKRGDIFKADLGYDKNAGSEQQGERPVVIIQNDIGNKYSPTVIVASVTSQINKAKLPVHVETKNNFYLDKNSIILLEQIRTLDKRKLKGWIGRLDYLEMKNLDEALKVSVGL